MKKKYMIIWAIICLVLLFFVVNYIRSKTMPSMSAIIVKVNEDTLDVMTNENNHDLYNVYYEKNDNIEFKQGQEVLIYWDGMILLSYPGQIRNVEKIEIVKEKSDYPIPEEVLKYHYNSYDNVEITVSELTKKGITLVIKDENELEYNYAYNDYRIDKKNKEAENVTVDESKIEPSTEHSIGAYIPDNVVTLWEEVQKKTNKDKNVDIQNTDKNTHEIECDWSSIYGELESGEYNFILPVNELLSNNIIINFTISEDGEIVYNKPTFR